MLIVTCFTVKLIILSVGGFIVDEAHFGQEEENPVAVPYPYQYAEDILKHCQENRLNAFYGDDEK